MGQGNGRRATLRRLGAAAALAAVIGAPAPAAAQDTRAEVLAREKARKAQALRPYEPGRAERIVTRLGTALVEMPRGLYPAFGSIYPGGGFAVGPAVRGFIGDESFVEAKALVSFRNYKRVEVSGIWPRLAGGRLALRTDAGWLDATQVGFYGLGLSSSAAGANFRMKETYGGAEARLRAAGPFVLGGAVALEDYALESGRGRRPSIETRFTPDEAPGLGSSPRFVHAAASAGIDSRPAAGYTRGGSVLEAEYHAYRDTDDRFSFDRLDATVIQHLPIARERWVLSLRGRMQTTLDDDDVVPYFLLPSLGSGSTLRGYSTGRFRDRHALLLQAEWRWIVNRSGLDMALFYDAGKVAARRQDLDFDGLKGNVGIGVRFHGPAMTPLRVELARGREGFNLVFAGGASF